MASREEKAACLALLTHAAWDQTLPSPLTRKMYHHLAVTGKLRRSMQEHTDAANDDPVYVRAQQLLARIQDAGRILNVLERQGYDMILPSDAQWPKKLRLLGDRMPAFLFLMGNSDLLTSNRIAVAGSRDILEETASLAAEVGRRLAKEAFVMVCGGANGVDDYAQRAILEADGGLILVPALPVTQLLNRHTYLKEALDSGRLLLLYDTLPEEPFSPGKALARNHTIYALGEAAVVVASRCGAGGSWRGAVDCLRGGYTPVYALYGENLDMMGNQALCALGAKRIDAGQSIAKQIGKQNEQLDMFGEAARC